MTQDTYQAVQQAQAHIKALLLLHSLSPEELITFVDTLSREMDILKHAAQLTLATQAQAAKVLKQEKPNA